MPTKKPDDHQAKQETGPSYELVEVNIADDDEEPVYRPARRATINVLLPGVEEVKPITVTVVEDALDDFELLDDLRAVQDDNDPSRFPSLIRRLLGDDYRDVMNELRGTNGRVSVAVGTEFVWELFRALNPNS
jgi:hypothetical protein